MTYVLEVEAKILKRIHKNKNIIVIFNRLAKESLSIPIAIKDIHSGKKARFEEHNARRKDDSNSFRSAFKVLPFMLRSPKVIWEI